MVRENEIQRHARLRQNQQAGAARNLQFGLIMDRRLVDTCRSARKQEEQTSRDRQAAQDDLVLKRQALAEAVARKQAIERMLLRREHAMRRRRARKGEEESLQDWIRQIYSGDPKAVNSPM